VQIEYYAQRAGAGLTFIEGTFVRERDKGGTARAGRNRAADAVHSSGGLIFVQLWHQGSVSNRSLYPDGRLPPGPSAINPEQPIRFKGGRIMSETPREMSLQDVKQAVEDCTLMVGSQNAGLLLQA
jgi:N-ethylmaleimide reductase